MPTMQIRNVSRRTTRVMKARAAAAGQSLSEYLRTQVQQIAARPTLDDVLERIAARPVADLPLAAEVLRRERTGA